jgi:hypothetical protein
VGVAIVLSHLFAHRAANGWGTDDRGELRVSEDILSAKAREMEHPARAGDGGGLRF